MKTSTLLFTLAGALLAGAAQADTVLVHSKGSAAITVDQACGAFLGKGGDLVAINLPEGNAARDEFFKKYCDKDAQQVKAIWAKLIFTGKASSKPKEAPSVADVKKLLAADANAVGYIDKASVDASVKVIGN